MSTLLLVENATAPGTPSANQVIMYPKSDGLMYSKDDAGTESPVSLSVPVSVANGGTGAATLGDAGVLIGNGTGAIQVTGAGTSGQVLTSNGAGVDPTFQAVPITGSQGITTSGSDVRMNTNNSGGIGAYAIIYNNGGSSIADGATVSANFKFRDAFGGTPTGTWRNVCGAAIADTQTGLCIRTA